MKLVGVPEDMDLPATYVGQGDFWDGRLPVLKNLGMLDAAEVARTVIINRHLERFGGHQRLARWSGGQALLARFDTYTGAGLLYEELSRHEGGVDAFVERPEVVELTCGTKLGQENDQLNKHLSKLLRAILKPAGEPIEGQAFTNSVKRVLQIVTILKRQHQPSDRDMKAKPLCYEDMEWASRLIRTFKNWTEIEKHAVDCDPEVPRVYQPKGKADSEKKDGAGKEGAGGGGSSGSPGEPPAQSPDPPPAVPEPDPELSPTPPGGRDEARSPVVFDINAKQDDLVPLVIWVDKVLDNRLKHVKDLGLALRPELLDPSNPDSAIGDVGLLTKAKDGEFKLTSRDQDGGGSFEAFESHTDLFTARGKPIPRPRVFTPENMVQTERQFKTEMREQRALFKAMDKAEKKVAQKAKQHT